MSPTSFQTAPPRVNEYIVTPKRYHLQLLFEKKWMEVDSNHRSNLQQIYSLSPLATREFALIELVYTLFCKKYSNGAYRARTCDPLLVRQMLSQLS